MHTDVINHSVSIYILGDQQTIAYNFAGKICKRHHSLGPVIATGRRVEVTYRKGPDRFEAFTPVNLYLNSVIIKVPVGILIERPESKNRRFRITQINLAGIYRGRTPDGIAHHSGIAIIMV